MLRSGATQAEVGARFGVSQAAISAAIRRGRIKWERPNQAEGRAVPWHPIRKEHRDQYLIRMLRVNHRRQQGLPSAAVLEAMLDNFLADAQARDFVVTYDPDTEQGFFRVSRRPGVDRGLVRDPSVDDRGWPTQRPK